MASLFSKADPEAARDQRQVFNIGASDHRLDGTGLWPGDVARFRDQVERGAVAVVDPTATEREVCSGAVLKVVGHHDPVEAQHPFVEDTATLGRGDPIPDDEIAHGHEGARSHLDDP